MEEPLLQLKNVRTWFPIREGVMARITGHVRAVDGVSLDIQPGETLGLVGESGCGKSTLARTIMQLEPLHDGEILYRSQRLNDLSSRKLRAMRRQIQVIFQDPFASLNPRMTVMGIITEGLLEHDLIRAEEQVDKATELLSDVGLGPDALYRYPHEFSGGQRQRISIARAISMKPELIICDEAVSALDVSVQAQIINLLTDLREKYNLAYLFIAHDLSVVRHLSHRIAVMYLGRIVEQGSATDVVDHPQHPYTRALISAVPRPGQKKEQRIVLEGDVPSPANPPAGCPFHPRCPEAIDDCQKALPDLRAMPARNDIPHQTACIRR